MVLTCCAEERRPLMQLCNYRVGAARFPCSLLQLHVNIAIITAAARCKARVHAAAAIAARLLVNMQTARQLT